MHWVKKFQASFNPCFMSVSALSTGDVVVNTMNSPVQGKLAFYGERQVKQHDIDWAHAMKETVSRENRMSQESLFRKMTRNSSF